MPGHQLLYPVFFTILFLITGCGSKYSKKLPLEISSSMDIAHSTYNVKAPESIDDPLITVKGDGIVIDFQHGTIDARGKDQMPDEFSGIAIRIDGGRNITVRNLKVHGFKFAVYATGVENLVLENCDFSYNYRPELNSKWDRESFTDWLYFHNNEHNDWLQYGSAIYIQDCKNSIIRNNVSTQGFNALMLVRSDSGAIYNNNFSFNSGLGIGMYRSSYHSIMHNKLDWNARGYSHGQYARGQDSAGILLYEQSSHNTIAYNSATHSGDGLFLWAGQSTMNTGEGGCNQNIIYRNDFSHSVANGIEVTFSSNFIIENKITDCRYGIWGGYSHNTLIQGNTISECETGIAIEHGNRNVICNNTIENGRTGVYLWERDNQPSDWAFSQKRNVHSRNYDVINNIFNDLNTCIKIVQTDSVNIAGNTFGKSQTHILFDGNEKIIPAEEMAQCPVSKHITLPAPLADAIDITLAEEALKGRQFIIVNEWGPYNFEYPAMILRRRAGEEEQEVLNFSLFGPTGNWKLLNGEGMNRITPKTGSFPGSVEVELNHDSSWHSFAIAYLGVDYVNQFGDTITKGSSTILSFYEFTYQGQWNIKFFNYDSLTDPLQEYAEFEKLLNDKPHNNLSATDIRFQWWGSPAERINEDNFATVSSTSINTPAGTYNLSIESDDGFKLYIDGKVVMQNWNIHDPTIDHVQIELAKGKHELRLEHFDAGGLAILDFEITPANASGSVQ